MEPMTELVLALELMPLSGGRREGAGGASIGASGRGRSGRWSGPNPVRAGSGLGRGRSARGRRRGRPFGGPGTRSPTCGLIGLRALMAGRPGRRRRRH